MTNFLDFVITGDPAFDFFFSITASIGILGYLSSFAISLFRGR